MNPSKVIRDRVVKLTDLPNIGKASEADLRLIDVPVRDEVDEWKRAVPSLQLPIR